MNVLWLRPGEHAIEQLFTGESTAGASCAVASVERTSSFFSGISEHVEHSACKLTGPGRLGEAEAALSVTDVSDEPREVVTEVVYVDGDGARRGIGNGFTALLEPGASADIDVFSVVDFRDDLTCEVTASFTNP